MSIKKFLCACAALTTVSIGVEAQLPSHQTDLRLDQTDQTDQKDYTDVQIRDGA